METSPEHPLTRLDSTRAGVTRALCVRRPRSELLSRYLGHLCDDVIQLPLWWDTLVTDLGPLAGQRGEERERERRIGGKRDHSRGGERCCSLPPSLFLSLFPLQTSSVRYVIPQPDLPGQSECQDTWKTGIARGPQKQAMCMSGHCLSLVRIISDPGQNLHN